MTDFFFVGGPMNASSIKSVDWAEPTSVYNKPIEGSSNNQSFYFTSLAGKGEPAINLLMRAAKLDPSTVKSVGIGGFSAFHGLANEMLKEDASRARIDLVYLADACFGGTAPKEPKQGYFAFATQALKRKKLLIATTSGAKGVPVTYTSGGQTVTHGSGYDCVRQLYQAAQSAVPTPESVPELPEGLPAPITAVRAGNFIWLDYGARITHAEHATKIMAPMLQHYGVGWMASRSMPGGLGGDSSKWIAGLAGIAGGYVLGKWLARRWTR